MIQGDRNNDNGMSGIMVFNIKTEIKEWKITAIVRFRYVNNILIYVIFAL